MTDSKLQNSYILQRLLYLFAWVGSLVLLIILRLENAPMHVALIAVITCFLWFGAYKLRGHEPLLSEQPVPDPIEGTTADTSLPIERYYARLIDSMDKNWLLCDTDLDQAQSTLRNVHHALIEAIDTAKSTGMLALNSMIAATNTGEVGRGFVTVSRDLVSISEQSGRDLQQMKIVVAGAQQRLLKTRNVLDEPWLKCLSGQGEHRVADLVESITCAQGAQEELRRIAERYQRSSKSDVRWLQLGDAVRRLLNELINVLYQFELRMTDVISDLRLVKLSSITTEKQLVEFKGRFSLEPAEEEII